MTDEVGVIISAQTYGETLAANQVAYLKSDGKWWKARANATATSTGEIGLVLDAGTSGRILKLGYRENSSWNWTPGAPVYLSAATAGALTQTRPTGAGTVVRIVGYPASATVLWVDPADPLTLATVEGLTATKGDLIGGEAGAWSNIGVSTDPWARLHPNSAKAVGLEWFVEPPELRNRILRIKDGAGNDLEIHQVYIPLFDSEGFPDPNLNGIECGGFWIDKYQACMFDASNVSRGSSGTNSPGTHGAASKPGVVIWTDINWNNSKIAIENRGGTDNKKAGTCAAFGAGSPSEFYVAAITDLIGRRVRITQGGVSYVRRIVKTGGDVDADANAAKLVEIYPTLPAPITAADTYEIVQHYLPGPFEWFSLAAWAMKYRYQYGLGYPKGNTNWGKDAADPRNAIYEGRPDPVSPGYTGNAIARCLAGTGPATWSLNGKESGVYDLVGNVFEWIDQVVGTTADRTIDAQYPGAGVVLPATSGNIATLYAPAKDGEHSLAAEVFAPATIGSANPDYDNDYYWQATGQRAAHRGGFWSGGADYGLFCLSLGDAPSTTNYRRGFRGVC